MSDNNDNGQQFKAAGALAAAGVVAVLAAFHDEGSGLLPVSTPGIGAIAGAVFGMGLPPDFYPYPPPDGCFVFGTATPSECWAARFRNGAIGAIVGYGIGSVAKDLK